uniref:Strawberry notch AAA domain-containing protein n=1 Tax=Panthera tigris altaica TaxID=74533 RepID=A0A8C9M6G6_PANTA
CGLLSYWDSTYLDELSNASIFSSSVDSLSDIADTPDFLPADSLSQVPTIWDVSTGPSAQDKLLLPRGPWTGVEDPVSSLSSTPLLVSYQSQSQPEEEEEAEEEEGDELGHAETYADYVPSKCECSLWAGLGATSIIPARHSRTMKSPLPLPGKQHPDRVVETSTLSSVPPPDITYTLALPASDSGALSALQLEPTPPPPPPGSLPRGAHSGLGTPHGAGGGGPAVSHCPGGDIPRLPPRGCIPPRHLAELSFRTGWPGASGQGPRGCLSPRTVLDPCPHQIVFDECHKAKNASSTKMGKAVLDLQNKLPLARVVYASATGASEPRNMIYMSRLGIWGDGTPFRTFEEFLHAIEKRGVGAMEIVAMDMKVSGMYIARQLSFSGVTFRIEEIPLAPAFERVYNRAALLVSRVAGLWGAASPAPPTRWVSEPSSPPTSPHSPKCVVIGLQSTGEARTREVLDQKDGQLDCFVSAAEGVFLSLIQKHFPSTKRKRERGVGSKRKRRPRGRGAKAPRLVCEVAGVIRISDDSSTESDAGLDSDFHSSPESVLDDDVVILDAIGLPADDRGPLCPLQRDPHGPGVLERVERLRQDLLAKGRALGRELPVNTLDELIDQLGGPEHVAEVSI